MKTKVKKHCCKNCSMEIPHGDAECPLCGYVPARPREKLFPTMALMLIFTPSLLFSFPLITLGLMALPESWPALFLGSIMAIAASVSLWFLRRDSAP